MTPERIAELRKALEGVTNCAWEPGCLCDEESRCNCRYIFADNGQGSTVASVHINESKDDDNPPLSEAKANQRFIATFSPPVVSELLDTVERLREAITPSADTKAAYMGEFSFPFPVYDRNGDEQTMHPNVPWTTIKEIMKAIAARAGGSND